MAYIVMVTSSTARQFATFFGAPPIARRARCRIVISMPLSSPLSRMDARLLCTAHQDWRHVAHHGALCMRAGCYNRAGHNYIGHNYMGLNCIGCYNELDKRSEGRPKRKDDAPS